MANTVNIWEFLESSDDLPDGGNTVNLTVLQNTTEGSMACTITRKSVTRTEYGRRATTGQDWTTWGVPAGATVSSVDVSAWVERTESNTKLTSHSVKMRIIDSSGFSIVASDLVDFTLTTATNASFTDRGPGGIVNVNASAAAAATDVRMEFEYTTTTGGGGGGADVDWRLGSIELSINYTAAVGGGRKVIIIS